MKLLKSLLIVFLVTLGVATDTYAQDIPAQMGITPSLTPEILNVLDNTGTWVPLGTVNSATHTFYPATSPFSAGPIVATAYGMDPTGNTPSDAGLLSFWAACEAPGASHWCYIPSGHYVFATSDLLDLSLNQAGGFTLFCGGNSGGSVTSGTLLDWSGTPGNYLTMASSAPEGIFNGHFMNCGILANAPASSGGAAFQIGQNNFSDGLNGFEFSGLWVENLAAAANTEGARVNSVATSTFRLSTFSDGCTQAFGVCPTAGYGLALYGVGFSKFDSIAVGDGAYGLYLTYYVYGNNFDNFDMEVLNRDLLIDSPSVSNNTFHGGTWEFCDYGVTASAGISNILDNPTNVGIYGGSGCPGSTNTFLNSPTTGILWRNSAQGVTTPVPVPASTVISTPNNTGRRVNAIFTASVGGTLSEVCFGVLAGTCIIPASDTGSVTVTLAPGDSYALTYSGTVPSMVWVPVE